MKKVLLCVFAILYLSCGLVLASPVPADHLAFKAYADQHIAAEAKRNLAEVMQPRSLESKRSPALRSDMRIASAGMVFNRTNDQVLHWARSSA